MDYVKLLTEMRDCGRKRLPALRAATNALISFDGTTQAERAHRYQYAAGCCEALDHAIELLKEEPSCQPMS